MPAELVLHAGGKEVSDEELTRVDLPASTRTWVPIKHTTVLDTAVATLAEAGFAVVKQRLALSNQGARFFGTLDLATELTKDGSVDAGGWASQLPRQNVPDGLLRGRQGFLL